MPYDGWRFETLNFWIRFTFHDFRFHIPCFENPFVFVLFSFLFWRLPLIRGGAGCIRPIVARVTWDFACVFVCFGSGILFVSLEKVFILALQGIRFPSLLSQTQISNPQNPQGPKRPTCASPSPAKQIITCHSTPQHNTVQRSKITQYNIVYAGLVRGELPLVKTP